jgi:hypothetical protein
VIPLQPDVCVVEKVKQKMNMWSCDQFVEDGKLNAAAIQE